MPHPFLGLGFNSWSQKFSRGNVPAAVTAFLQYITTSDTSSFTLLSTGTVDYEVDWGDGTTESLTTNNPTHAYSSAGEYTIKVTPAEGSTYRPHFNDAISDTSIASVSGTGGSQLGTTLHDAWDGASNMTSFGENVDTSSVTRFDYAWSKCSSLTSFPQLDTSSGTSFSYAWYNCTGLTSFPLLDTSSVTNFYGAWYDTGLTSFPLLDTSSGTSFGRGWRDCSSLTSFPLLDTSSGTNFTGAWQSCSGLTSFPLLDTSSGTNFSNAWYGNTSLTSFPLIDTSSGSNFSGTWNTCSGLTSFPQLDFSSGTYFFSAWFNCNQLTSFPANMFDTTGTLTSTAFNGAWRYCALTAQSIENILVSLDTNGASNITLSINNGTNASKTTWSTAANTAYDNLITKGWTISYNA